MIKATSLKGHIPISKSWFALSFVGYLFDFICISGIVKMPTIFVCYSKTHYTFASHFKSSMVISSIYFVDRYSLFFHLLHAIFFNFKLYVPMFICDILFCLVDLISPINLIVDLIFYRIWWKIHEVCLLVLLLGTFIHWLCQNCCFL